MAILSRGTHNRESPILFDASASVWNDTIASKGRTERSATRAGRSYGKELLQLNNIHPCIYPPTWPTLFLATYAYLSTHILLQPSTCVVYQPT